MAVDRSSALETQDWEMQLERLRSSGELDDREGYRRLRQAGASPREALGALISSEPPYARASMLAYCPPRGLGLRTLKALLKDFSIHPLSVAVGFQDRRRARSFLRRLGLEEIYGNWIGPGGRLLLRDPQVTALPAGLVLRGTVMVIDCPELSDLGEGFTCLAGDIVIKGCPQLCCLPDRMETFPITAVEIAPDGTKRRLPAFLGNLFVSDCPRLAHFGSYTRIRGRITIEGCKKLQGVDLGDVQASPFQG